MRKLFFLISLIALFSSCITQKRINKICGMCPKDSVIINDTIYKDSIVKHTEEITVPSDSSLLIGLLACDSLNNVYIKELSEYKGQHISTILSLKNNILYLKAKLDGYTFYKTWFENHRYIKISNRKILTKTVEVNKLTKFQKIFIKTGQIAWILILIAVGYYVFRFLTKRGIISRLFK